jgi:tetratricopeptide (TPR) repeat protein
MNSGLSIKARTVVAAGAVVALCCSAGRPIENPSIFNPADCSTIVPSSYQSSPISSPIGFDSKGNLIITGNVRRGMHFRGGVPYESTMSFWADLGSASLNSFLRDSAGTQDLGNSAGKYGIQPYFLPSGTVATMRPGYSGVFGRGYAGIRNHTLRGRFQAGTYVADTNAVTFSGKDVSTADSELPVAQTRYAAQTKPHTIVQSIRELKLLTRQAGQEIPSRGQQLMVERYRRKFHKRRDKGQTTEYSQRQADITFEMSARPSFECEHSLIEKYGDFEPLDLIRDTQEKAASIKKLSKIEAEPKPTLLEEYLQANAGKLKDEFALQQDAAQVLQTDEAMATQSDIVLQVQNDTGDTDIAEQVRRQLEDLIKTVGAGESPEAEDTGQNSRTKTGLTSAATDRQRSLNTAESIERGAQELEALPQSGLSAEAGKVGGAKTNPDTFSASRFNHRFQQANARMKSGRYYEAADSFALASIYKPGDPLCLAGRGHALLAAGEYISSALFIARAVEASPEYLQEKIDLATLLGSQNIVENRIADIKERTGGSSSAKLQLLLGYLYYRMGRCGPAQQAIDAACAKMPDSPAAAALKKAIDSTMDQ